MLSLLFLEIVLYLQVLYLQVLYLRVVLKYHIQVVPCLISSGLILTWPGDQALALLRENVIAWHMKFCCMSKCDTIPSIIFAGCMQQLQARVLPIE